jgi:excisionase family DNA binding protein
MSESAARITLSAKGLIMKIVGDVLIIETSDPDELRREVNRALGDEPLTVQGAAGYLKVSTRTIRNWIKDGKLPAKQFNGSGYRIQKRDLEQIQTDILSPAI